MNIIYFLIFFDKLFCQDAIFFGCRHLALMCYLNLQSHTFFSLSIFDTISSLGSCYHGCNYSSDNSLFCFDLFEVTTAKDLAE